MEPGDIPNIECNVFVSESPMRELKAQLVANGVEQTIDAIRKIQSVGVKICSIIDSRVVDNPEKLRYHYYESEFSVIESSMDIEQHIALVTKINEATKDIPDEDNRKLAFRSLMSKAGLDGPVLAPKTVTVEPGPGWSSSEKAPTDTPSSRKAKKSKGNGQKSVPDIDPELNLEPEGKPSFAEFVKRRTLNSHVDRISAAIFYLREVLKLEGVGLKQAATCYEDQDWDWPSDFRNTISQGKKQKRFHYETMDDVKLTTVETNAMKKETAAADA